jgi:hypothetical protein
MKNKPTWLYKSADIPNTLLPLFQKEFTKIYKKFVKDLDKQPNQFVSEEDISIIPNEYPYIYKYLKLLGLHKSIVRLGLIVTTSPELTFAVHSDWPATGYALNIPVLNCENTYTAWYDAKITNVKGNIYSTDSWKGVAESYMYDNSTAVELDRIEANKPHWINIHVPHSPISDLNKLRINATIRFTDDVYDFLNRKYPC